MTGRRADAGGQPPPGAAGQRNRCSSSTAMDALNSGFRPQVVRQACADRTAGLHEANLADLDAKYADVIELALVLARLDDRDAVPGRS
ncbi:isochorismatase family protein [Blastococcus sp. BMG 814]|uniref:Isochorismatase family protein n=1 Tax=Blastococcus carthaginiensis TaxID=3050034 RepID=A0ABT9IFV2_9ACTN|nr:isochorismatase family protein [Blastococcus carthaginiensis]MDP5184460.1 isochorismatase family protein [Blastococcus carthaginiensis]